jgi:hypothetical protein
MAHLTNLLIDQQGCPHLGQYFPGRTQLSTPRASHFGHLTPGICKSSLLISNRRKDIGQLTAHTGKQAPGAAIEETSGKAVISGEISGYKGSMMKKLRFLGKLKLS